MRRLFDDTVERYTEEANQIGHEICRALQPIFDRYMTDGISARDFGTVAEWEIRDMVLCYVLTPPEERKHNVSAPQA